jgi:hypothetical protein
MVRGEPLAVDMAGFMFLADQKEKTVKRGRGR